MPSHQCSQTAVIKWLLFACLLYSGSRLEAQIEAPAPVPTTEAPSKSKETSDDSEFKIHNYQLKHAKAAEVLKLFKQLHGVKNTATVDERTNSIVFLANETDARELRESLALLDGDALPPVIPPTPVVQRSSPEVRVPSKFESPNAKLRFRKFTFKHAKVADVVKILRELTGANIDHENMEGFAVDELTNSVIWKVKDEWSSRHWKETLLTLDGESSASKTQSAPSPYRHLANTPTPVDLPSSPNSQVSAQPTQTFTFSMGLERGESLDSLKQRYNVLEQKTHQLADKLKQSKSPGEPERTELQTAVRKSFEARQALQRAELADLAQRMQSMQQSIDMRDKLADKVIARRVEDLLNPNLKWDVTRTSTESTHAIAKEVLMRPSKITSSQEMQAALQGTWTVRAFQANDQGDDRLSQVVIRGDLLLMHTIVNGKVIGVSPWKLVWPNAEMPYEIGAIWDPNTNTESEPFMPGRIAYDGKSFQLAFGENPISAICPGENVTYIDCVRDNIDDRAKATQAPSSISTNKPGEADLSTPQATLDYLHGYSLAHPGGFPAECYTDEAVLELSGMMLQNLSMMSAMSQIALQTGGVIGESNGVPVVSDTSPAFHILVEALLREQMLPTPPESADKAFELLATLTFGGDSSNPTASVQVDRQFLRLAAGVLKSPKEFLPAASKLLETFGQTDADVTKSKEADQTQPKADIAINRDEATATLIGSGNESLPSPLTAPRVTKLRRIDGRWLISEILSDEEIVQLQSSYSSVMDQLGAKDVTSDNATSADATQRDINKPTSAKNGAAKTVTRRYSVGSFVTESFFTDKGNPETQEAYDKHEPEIEQSLRDLAKTVTATCTQPPKFVQVLSNSRCLLIGHTEAGHEEIADFMRDIGINNDRIRLRGVTIEISKDEAESLGIELTHGVLLRSSEDAEKLRAFQKDEKSDSENSSRDFHFVAMDARIQSGTRTHMKTSDGLEQVPIAARIVPGTKEVQIRIDRYGYSNGSEHFHPQFQTLTDGQSVLFALAGDLWWLGTADIVRDSASAIEEGAEDAKPGRSDTPPTDEDENVENAKTEWNDLLQLIPESGTALVMFSYEPEIKEQMLPVAQKVAEAASAQLIELPQSTWHKIIAPPATHFVLMKDRQLVGTRTD